MSAQTTYEIPAKQITPSNFSCGEIIEGDDGEQYAIIDCLFVEEQQQHVAVIKLLSDDERVKPEYLGGTFEF